MEKLIEFLREANLLDRNLQNWREVTIEMSQEEFDKENFFTEYIKTQCDFHMPINLTNEDLDITKIKSMTFPHGFTLQIKIK